MVPKTQTTTKIIWRDLTWQQKLLGVFAFITFFFGWLPAWLKFVEIQLNAFTDPRTQALRNLLEDWWSDTPQYLHLLLTAYITYRIILRQRLVLVHKGQLWRGAVLVWDNRWPMNATIAYIAAAFSEILLVRVGIWYSRAVAKRL